MANYLTTDTELTSIADAIRTKGGTNAQLEYPTGFVTAINAIPTGGGETINVQLTGDLGSAFQYSFSKYLMENHQSSFNITTSNVTNLNSTFYGLNVSDVGFDINIAVGATVNLNNLFYGSSLTTIPTINWNGGSIYNGHMRSVFQGMHNIEDITDIFDGANMSNFQNGNNNLQYFFMECYNLETISSDLLAKLYTKLAATSYTNYMFYQCYSLKRINNLGIFNPTATITSNVFNSNMFEYTGSLTSLTFNANGAARNYSNQSIRLNAHVGWLDNNPPTTVTNYTGGTTIADSVYNHASAVETINSLPDCSAVSPASNPNNTIIFAAGAGANTAGGSISDLTAAEIAVATNKGWNVSIL